LAFGIIVCLLIVTLGCEEKQSSATTTPVPTTTSAPTTPEPTTLPPTTTPIPTTTSPPTTLKPTSPPSSNTYIGDWCSFEAPENYIVYSEDSDSVILQKIISTDLIMQLTVCRTVGDSTDTMLKFALKTYTTSFVEAVQKGFVEDCVGEDEINMIEGIQGRTAYNVVICLSPYIYVYGYTWGEGDNIVVMSLCWMGSGAEDKDTNYLIEPIGNAYKSFRYYG